MTSRELEILNIIYRLGCQCSMRLISKETGLSPDYVFLITKKLIDQKLIKKIANNVFILTANGRSFLERKIHFINPEASASWRSCGAGREFMNGEPHFTEHNLGKDITIEVTDARSIQPSLKRLTQKL